MKYRTNGGGRDSYIYDSNGGNTVTNVVESKPLHRSGRIDYGSPSKKSVSPKQASAVDTQRPIHYNTNGTGRDTYIGATNGGFST